MEPYDAWQEYADHYDEYHGTISTREEYLRHCDETLRRLSQPPNKSEPRTGIGRTDQYADAPIDVPRLVKIAHAHLALAIQGCQSESKLDEVADRRVLQEALWGLESLISIWSLDSGK